MSDMRVEGVPIKLFGKQFNIVFSVNVIDQFQEHFNASIFDGLADVLAYKKKDGKTGKETGNPAFFNNLAYMLTIMANDAIERDAVLSGKPIEGIRKYSLNEVKTQITLTNFVPYGVAVSQAYMGSYQTKSEDDISADPNAESGQNTTT